MAPEPTNDVGSPNAAGDQALRSSNQQNGRIDDEGLDGEFANNDGMLDGDELEHYRREEVAPIQAIWLTSAILLIIVGAFAMAFFTFIGIGLIILGLVIFAPTYWTIKRAPKEAP